MIKNGGIKYAIEKSRQKAHITYLKHKSKNGFHIKNIQGSNMYLDLNDWGISRELLFTGYHEKTATKIFKKELKKGMTTIDLGSNIGYYALMQSSLIGDSGRVYAIEPVPENYELLKKSIELNNYNNIKTYKIGISNNTGKTLMNTTMSSNQGSLLNLSEEKVSDYMIDKMNTIGKETIEIKITTLDEFIKKENIKKLDFLRMDIEGYEIEAIDSMKETLNTPRAPENIFIEIHTKLFKNPKKDLIPTIKKLLEAGYRAKYMVIKSEDKTYKDLENKELIDQILSHKIDCPHIFFTKNKN